MHLLDSPIRSWTDEPQSDQIPLLVELLEDEDGGDCIVKLEDNELHGETSSSPPNPLHRQVSSSSSSSSSSSTTKLVSFSKVHVREHCVIIGDSLSCDVLPLSLGWGHTEEQTFDVNTYEELQRKKKSLLFKPLTFAERLDLLQRVSGMKHSEIMLLERERSHHATRRCAMSS